MTLKMYLETESVPVMGQIIVDVGCNGQRAELPLVVIKGKGPSLFGHDWLSKLKLD